MKKLCLTGWKPVPPFSQINNSSSALRPATLSGTGILPVKLLLHCFLLVGILACSRSRSHEEARFQMTLLTGENFSEQLASSPEKLVLINFWATWCEPCKEEFPGLVKAEKDLHGKGIAFWAVSCDTKDDISTKVPQFLKESDSSLKPFWVDLSQQEEIINVIWPEWPGTIPATFIFRRSGERIFEHMGQMSYEQFKAAIEQALKEER